MQKLAGLRVLANAAVAALLLPVAVAIAEEMAPASDGFGIARPSV